MQKKSNLKKPPQAYAKVALNKSLSLYFNSIPTYSKPFEVYPLSDPSLRH